MPSWTPFNWGWQTVSLVVVKVVGQESETVDQPGQSLLWSVAANERTLSSPYPPHHGWYHDATGLAGPRKVWLLYFNRIIERFRVVFRCGPTLCRHAAVELVKWIANRRVVVPRQRSISGESVSPYVRPSVEARCCSPFYYFHEFYPLPTYNFNNDSTTKLKRNCTNAKAAAVSRSRTAWRLNTAFRNKTWTMTSTCTKVNLLLLERSHRRRRTFKQHQPELSEQKKRGEI